MSPVCAAMQARVDAYLEDALTAEERRALREHLLSCGDCRREAAAAEPTLRFARPLGAPTSAAETARVWDAVKTGVRLMEAERRVGGARPSARRRRATEAAAAAALALLTLLVPGGSPRSTTPDRTDSAPAVANANAFVEPETGLRPAANAVLPEASPSHATVYDWNPGAGREEPRVVWIVDRGLDI